MVHEKYILTRSEMRAVTSRWRVPMITASATENIEHANFDSQHVVTPEYEIKTFPVAMRT